MTEPGLPRALLAPLKAVVPPRAWAWLRGRWMARRACAGDAAENARHWRGGPGVYVVSEAGTRHAYGEFLAWLAEHDPALRARLYLDHLPGRRPPGTRVLHAWVQDPVRERDPALFARLERLEADVTAAGGRVIQPARVLSHSQRTVLCDRLQGAGVRTPRVLPLTPAGAAALSAPVLVRHRWGHGAPMLRLDTDAAVAAWRAAVGDALEAWVAAEYVETCGPDGLYRKYRYLMFGATGIARHLITSAHWEVRPKDRVLTAASIAEELRYVAAPVPEHDLFDRARRALAFDIAAFDYSVTPAGEVVVWEVNPYPDLSRPKGEPGRYLHPTWEASNRALAAYYRDALASAGG